VFKVYAKNNKMKHYKILFYTSEERKNKLLSSVTGVSDEAQLRKMLAGSLKGIHIKINNQDNMPIPMQEIINHHNNDLQSKTKKP